MARKLLLVLFLALAAPLLTQCAGGGHPHPGGAAWVSVSVKVLK
ncbi:MAG: hypothetical protein P8009_08235 [Gammaproteobacteria bacterium]